jgi:hypothetical protein
MSVCSRETVNRNGTERLTPIDTPANRVLHHTISLLLAPLRYTCSPFDSSVALRRTDSS